MGTKEISHYECKVVAWSKPYTFEALRSLIDRYTEAGWQFVSCEWLELPGSERALIFQREVRI